MARPIVDLPIGLEVQFEAETLILGGFTTRFRPEGHPPGSSSPQWIDKIVLGVTRDLALAAAMAAGIGGEPDPACTGSSKEVTLTVVREATQETVEGAHVLLTAAVYDLAAQGRPKHLAQGLKVSRQPFDTNAGGPAGSLDAKMWRTMSDFCESLFRNFG